MYAPGTDIWGTLPWVAAGLIAGLAVFAFVTALIVRRAWRRHLRDTSDAGVSI